MCGCTTDNGRKRPKKMAPLHLEGEPMAPPLYATSDVFARDGTVDAEGRWNLCDLCPCCAHSLKHLGNRLQPPPVAWNEPLAQG